VFEQKPFDTSQFHTFKKLLTNPPMILSISSCDPIEITIETACPRFCHFFIVINSSSPLSPQFHSHLSDPSACETKPNLTHRRRQSKHSQKALL
jgi:hypothetical protein